MSVDPTPRLGRAVRIFTPVVLIAGLAVPMFATADQPGNAGNPNPGTPQGDGPQGNPAVPQANGLVNNPGHGGTPPGHGGQNPGHGNGGNPGRPGDKGEKGDRGESSSTTVIVEAPARQFSENSNAGGLTKAPVVRRVCRSRRVVTLRLDRYYKVRAARVLVNGKRTTVRRTKKGVFVKVDLRGKKQGVYKVRTAVLTKGGKLRFGTRRFATCSARVKKRA